MSEQEDNAPSRVSISTGVIPFPSMDSSLVLPQTLSMLEECPSPSPEPMLRPSTSSSALPEPHRGSPSQKATSDDSPTLPSSTNPIPNTESPSPSPEPMTKASTSYSVAEESHVTTSSSRLTSSDKLTALPSSTGPLALNVTSTTKSPMLAELPNNNRGYRRSLDSLPSFSTADPDSRVRSQSIWGTPPGLNARTETDSNHGILERHSTPENPSTGKGTPKQRVSFDSDRGSLPTMHSVGQVFLRRTRGNDPQTTSPVSRPSAVEHRDVDSSSNPQDLGSPSQSPPRSRATSPLRVFQQWSSGLLGHRTSVEEPFLPINPFKLHYHFPFCCFPHTHDLETGEGTVISSHYDCDDLIPTKSIKSFIFDTLPRQLYLNFLLYLPALYFSRVARIFEDAEVSRPDIQRMIEALGPGGPGMMSTHHNGMPTTGTWGSNILAQSTPAHIPMSTFSPPVPHGVTVPVSSAIHMPLPFPDEWTPQLVSPALIRFKHSWEAFIDSLMREWKTLNLVSALLASTILTIFQIPDAEDDPVTRTAALLSLICALMSLSYGCMYIVRFGMMRNMFHASRWAEEAQKMKTSIWWNVWVLLAMPAVWMAWAMVLFLLAILSFTWRTGSVSDPSNRPPLSDRAALGPRIAITCVLLLGLGYMAMIVITLKMYGPPSRTPGMDTRNRMQGGGTPTHGDTAQSHESEKKIQARDIDAATERRGRPRQRSTSVRRREEDVERRQHGVVGNKGKKGGRNSKGLHRLGLGSARDGGELDEMAEAEMDLIDGLP